MINLNIMTEKYTAIVDHIGRTLIGVEVDRSDTTLSISNPLILHCQPESNGSLNVQTFPMFFFEFIDKLHRSSNVWKFNLSNIVTSDVILDERIIENYKLQATPPVPKTNPKIIKIDDV